MQPHAADETIEMIYKNYKIYKTQNITLLYRNTYKALIKY